MRPRACLARSFRACTHLGGKRAFCISFPSEQRSPSPRTYHHPRLSYFHRTPDRPAPRAPAPPCLRGLAVNGRAGPGEAAPALGCGNATGGGYRRHPVRAWRRPHGRRNAPAPKQRAAVSRRAASPGDTAREAAPGAALGGTAGARELLAGARETSPCAPP